MKFMLPIAVLELVIGAILIYAAGHFIYRIHASLGLLRTTKPFVIKSTEYHKTLLVLGDSTAVGLGATKPEDTVAGHLAAGIGATYVENHAVAGAVAADLPSQMQKMQLDHYDVVLLQIGANDVIGFKSASTTVATLRPSIGALAKRSTAVYWMFAGDVGSAPMFSIVLKPFYSALSMKYHAAFTELAAQTGITYVNLYTPPKDDPFVQHPGLYMAADGLHPTSAGYALFYGRLKEVAHL